MIMIRTPFRVSFVGGGSDLASFYRHGYGAVVSTTIDKNMYILVHPYFHNKIRIKYSRTEDVETVGQIQHPLVRECLRLHGIEQGIEIASFADVPAGSGLGSSSAFTVSLLHALHAYRGRSPSWEHLASEACRVEIDLAQEPIGKQDQYAVSCGGLNYIRFNPDETVQVESIALGEDMKRTLETRLLLFYVGRERPARDILAEQDRNMAQADKFRRVTEMASLAGELRGALLAGRVDDMGKILHWAWELKRELASGITSGDIDESYQAARQAGAVGGKLLGAGGGGFLLLYCAPEHQQHVRQTLGRLRELPFHFSTVGSKLLYSDSNNLAGPEEPWV